MKTTNKNKNPIDDCVARLFVVAEAFGDTTLPIHSLQLFLTVAKHDLMGEPLEGKELAKIMGLSTSAVSRNVASLGEWHRNQRPGMGLIHAVPDLADRRRKPIRLTKKGMRVVKQMIAAQEDLE